MPQNHTAHRSWLSYLHNETLTLRLLKAHSEGLCPQPSSGRPQQTQGFQKRGEQVSAGSPYHAAPKRTLVTDTLLAGPAEDTELLMVILTPEAPWNRRGTPSV